MMFLLETVGGIKCTEAGPHYELNGCEWTSSTNRLRNVGALESVTIGTIIITRVSVSNCGRTDWDGCIFHMRKASMNSMLVEHCEFYAIVAKNCAFVIECTSGPLRVDIRDCCNSTYAHFALRGFLTTWDGYGTIVTNSH
jgi:hypothetical protein